MKCLVCGSDRLDSASDAAPNRMPEFYCTTLFFDTGSGFRDEQSVSRCVSYPVGEFDLTLELESPTLVRGLRWDPLELFVSRVRLAEVAWLDRHGVATLLDVKSLQHNGARLAGDEFLFDTLDPMFLMAVQGEVAALRVRGHCEIEPLAVSLTREKQALEDQQARLNEQAVQIERLQGVSMDSCCTTLYFDTGAGYCAEQSVSQNVSYAGSTFELTLTLPAPAVVRGLRWDPLESRSCRLLLAEAVWLDRDGVETPIDRETIQGNGVRSADGEFVFDSFDPLLLLPVQGEVAAVRLSGRCTAEPLTTTVIRLRRSRDELWDQLHEYEQHFAQLQPLCHARGEYIKQLESMLRDRERSGFEPLYSSLMLDTGEGFSAAQPLYQPVSYDPPEFEITFLLASPTAVRRLRWDPIENHLCRVKLSEVSWQNREGVTTSLELDRLESNGVRDPEGEIVFDTLDPTITIPIEGEITLVRLRGSCVVALLAATMPRVRQLLAAQGERIARLEAHCHKQENDLAEMDAYCRLQEPQLQAAWSESEELRRQLIAARSEAHALSEELDTLRQEKRWTPVQSVGSALAFLPRLVRRWLRPRSRSREG